MKVLIISLPRTGSTQLLIDTSKKYDIKPISEPYNIMFLNKILYHSNMNNVVVKTIIGQTPASIKYKVESVEYSTQYLKWLYEFISDFDEIILLSRKDLKACIESISFLMYNMKTVGFNFNTPYYYKAPPIEIYENYEKEILVYDKIINKISIDLNIPIIYYEDLYDLNSPDRLRKGNANVYKKII